MKVLCFFPIHGNKVTLLCIFQFVIDNQVLSCLYQLLTQNHKKSIKKEACWTISNITAGNKGQIQVCDSLSIWFNIKILPRVKTYLWHPRNPQSTRVFGLHDRVNYRQHKKRDGVAYLVEIVLIKNVPFNNYLMMMIIIFFIIIIIFFFWGGGGELC